ncbi:MAG TPA: Xaa-Pro peptidase family protein [Candidatus Limnocylindria bacterium]|nr:Xaa-Pro peptidase family protein [Candidatus Limnocylindria bacterium]
MTNTIISEPTAPAPIPRTGAPFPRDEYARRREAVLGKVAEAGLDAIAVTAHSHQEYLSGYDGSGDYFGPFPLILAPGCPATYVVRRYDEDAVRAASVIDDIVPYTHLADAPRVWASALRALGLDRARLGLELDAWNLAPADVARLQAELPNLTIVDVSRIVAQVAAVKTPLELQVMRRAMVLTELAVDEFRAGIADGATEMEVLGRLGAAVQGGGGAAIVSALLFGQRTALPHGQPSDHRLRRDEPAFIEVGAEVDGYVTGLCRTAILGRHSGAEQLHAVALDALEAGLETIRPGIAAGDVDAASRTVIERAGRASAFRHRAGYQIGLMWNDRGNLSLEPDAVDTIVPGMTLHLPIILFERASYGVGVSETVLVTADGHEVLGRGDRALHLVP